MDPENEIKKKNFNLKFCKIFITSCLVVTWFLPLYLIAEIHKDLLLSNTILDVDIIKYVTIAFSVMAILGTILGLIIWPMLDLYDFVWGVLLIQIIANTLLLAFSFIGTLYGYRMIIILMILGLTIGLSQITITMFFANQYVDSVHYTLLNHFMLYFMLHTVVYIIMRLIAFNSNEFGSGKTTISGSKVDASKDDSYVWEFLLMILANMITLGLLKQLGGIASNQQDDNFNILGTKNNDKHILGSQLGIVWPLIFVVVCVRLLHLRWYEQCESMHSGFQSTFRLIEVQCRFIGYVVQPIVALLCIPLLKFVFLFGLDETNKLKLGYGFIAISAVLSRFVDLGIAGDKFSYYQIPKEQTVMRIFFNDGANFEKLTDPDDVFSNYSIFEFQKLYPPLMNWTSIWTENNQTNFTYLSPMEFIVKDMYYPFNNMSYFLYFEKGIETWNIGYYSKEAKFIFTMPICVYRRPSSLPLVYLFLNDEVLSATFSNSKLTIEARSRYMHEVLDGAYNLNTSDGQWWGKYKFKRGGFYVVLLYFAFDYKQVFFTSIDNLPALLTIIPPYSYNISWQLPQFVLLIMGIFMLVTSTLKILYNLPNSNIKYEVIALFFCIIDIGYLLYLILVDVLNLDLLENTFAIPVTLLLAFIYIHLFLLIWDYVILPT